jgi:hypothetical protein
MIGEADQVLIGTTKRCPDSADARDCRASSGRRNGRQLAWGEICMLAERL